MIFSQFDVYVYCQVFTVELGREIVGRLFLRRGQHHRDPTLLVVSEAVRVLEV